MAMFSTKYEQLIYQCLRIRMVEEEIARVYPTDKIQSPVHLSIGQEPASVGVCAALTKADLVFGTYRSHALYLAKGGCLKSMVAELFGRSTGCGAGRAGSMHLIDPDVGMMGSSAIVASTIPHAVGAAYAAKLLGREQIVVCFFGEAATAEGVYHESLNLAALHKLPILFVCENNDLAIYSKSSEHLSYKICGHAEGYGIKANSIVKAGYSLAKIADSAESIVGEIRNGSGPQLLEIEMYRYLQHVGPDSDLELDYRDPAEYREWLALDPLEIDSPLLTKFRPEIEAEIAQAFLFADNSPFPQADKLLEEVR